MYEYNDFHESYYRHSCSVIPERDVLDMDIVGSGFVARFRRWWHNLFLLSYTDNRSRTFYTSSHATRMERISQFRRYKNRIHPLSKFRTTWECILLHVFIANKLLFHFLSSILLDQLCIGYYYTALALELLILFDLFVSSKTGFIDHESRKVVLDVNKSIMHYCSTKLFLHVASAIPLSWIMFLRLGKDINCGLCKANTFVCFLKVISIFSLYRVYETSHFLTRSRPSAYRTHVFKFVRIGAVGLVTMFQFIDISDMICLLTMMNGHADDRYSFLSKLVLERYAYLKPSNNYDLAIYDFARILRSLILFSFSLSETIYYLEIMSSLIIYVTANFFYMWCAIEAYALVNRLKYPEDQTLITKRSALNFLECRQLSDKLRSKVEQYFAFNQTKYMIIEIEDCLYRSMPSVLKREAILSCYCRHLTKIPYFKEWPLVIIEELVLMLKREVYLKNDIVADAWVQGDGLVVVDMGVLAVYSAHRAELGHLIDGDYFGEVSLVTDREVRMSSLVAITPCSVLILRKTPFRKFMRHYPKLFFAMKQALKESYNKLPTRSVESLVSQISTTRRAERR